MATNTLKTRIKHKIGTATEWQTAAENSQFKPLEGELIIYEDATTPRLKVGDGSSLVTDLPFIDGIKVSVTGSGNAITAASYDENARTLTLTKGASYTNNTGDITGVTAGKGLTGGATSGTATLNVGAGAGITVTDDAVGHTNSVTADTASEGGSARTLAFGDSFNIPSVTYDAQGHITEKGSIALKLPAKPTYTDKNTTYDLAAAKSKANGSVTLDLTAGGSGSGTDSVTIKGTGATTVTTDANGVITINSTDTNTQTVTSVNSKTGDVSLTYSDVNAAPTSHNHSASNITSGTLDAARIPNISIDKLVAGTTNTTIPSSLLPAYVDDVLEYTAKANFPTTGETGKIYVDKTTNLTYRWSGSAYVEISPSLALGSTSSTAHRGDHGAAAYAHAVTNKGVAKSSGLYKITTNSEGHVTAATAVAKADITALGIPGSDTTYSAATSSTLGLVKSGGDVTISSAGVITVNDDSHNHTIANVDNLQTALDGKADKTQGVFYIEGGGTTDATNKVATWTGSHDDITAYYEGLAILYKISTAGSTTTTLNINDIGAVPVVRNATTAVSTSFPINSVILLVYTLDGTTAYWKAHDYDANTRNSVGDYRKNGTKLYFVGTTSSDSSSSSSYATSYTNSLCYVGTDNCLYSNGEKVLTADTNTTYTLSGAASGNTWVTTLTPSSGTATTSTVPTATTSAAGLMTPDMVTKLNGIATGATANTGDITGVTAGVGIAGGATSGTATVKAKLRSETALTVNSEAATTTSGRVYPVAVDKSGYLAVNVPWTDTDTNTNTTYTFATGSTNGTFTVTPSGGTAQSVAIKGLGSNAYTSTAYLPLAGGTVIGTTIFKGKDSTTGNNVNIYVQDYSGTNKLKITGADGKLCTSRIDTYGSGDNNFGFVTAIDGNSRGTIGISSNNELLFKAWNTAKVGSGDVPEVYKLPKPTATTKTTYDILTTKDALSYTTSGKNYKVQRDSTTGGLYVNVPWTDNNTVYTHPAGSGASKTSGLYKFSTDSTSHISGVTAVTKADITGLGIPGSDTNYYHTPSYTSTVSTTATGVASSSATNVKVATGTGVNDLYIPVATASAPGLTIVYPSASCTTFSSDAGTVTPLAVQKGAKMFAITRPPKDSPSRSVTSKAIARWLNGDGDLDNSKIIIEDVTNSKDSSKKAQVIVIPAEGNKKMVYGYCTDQVDGTSFIGGVFDNSATSYPYNQGLAIGGTSGNLLWKGARVATSDDLVVATTSRNGLMSTSMVTKLNGIDSTYAKKPTTYTFTIPILAETDGVLGQYMEEITGLSVNDTVFADIDLSAVNTEDWEAMEQAWSNIGRISTSDGAIVVHPKAATNVPINVILKIFK